MSSKLTAASIASTSPSSHLRIVYKAAVTATTFYCTKFVLNFRNSCFLFMKHCQEEFRASNEPAIHIWFCLITQGKFCKKRKHAPLTLSKRDTCTDSDLLREVACKPGLMSSYGAFRVKKRKSFLMNFALGNIFYRRKTNFFSNSDVKRLNIKEVFQKSTTNHV